MWINSWHLIDTKKCLINIYKPVILGEFWSHRIPWRTKVHHQHWLVVHGVHTLQQLHEHTFGCGDASLLNLGTMGKNMRKHENQFLPVSNVKSYIHLQMLCLCLYAQVHASGGPMPCLALGCIGLGPLTSRFRWSIQGVPSIWQRPRWNARRFQRDLAMNFRNLMKVWDVFEMTSRI